MENKETPEERRERLLKNLEKARKVKQENQEKEKAAIAAGIELPPKPKKRPKHLDRIVRDILDDDELVDKVVGNQPDYWQNLPTKNGGYIIATVMMVKAMGGDIKAAEWIRKTGFGDKVLLESDNGFFQKSDFTIQVVPSKQLDDGISADEVLDHEIKQIEEDYVS